MTEENIPQGTAPPTPEAVQNDEASDRQVDEVHAGQIEGKNPPPEQKTMQFMVPSKQKTRQFMAAVSKPKSKDSPSQSNDSPEE